MPPARLLLALAPPLLAACAAGPDGRSERGTFGLTLENDSYRASDGNYSNGAALAWVSGPLERLPRRALPRRMARAASFLPFTAEAPERRLALALGQLIFTPEDILAREPPPDAHPYSGLFYVDAALLARRARTLHAWTLRLGVVGEASFAEETQKELHSLFGGDRPRGWDRQLEDEPVANLGWEVHRLLLAGELPGELPWEIVPSAGAALGTWLVGARGGLELRTGYGLPVLAAAGSLRSGIEPPLLEAEAPGSHGTLYAYASVDGLWVAHWLPVDGNVLRDGPSTEREAVVPSATLGMGLGLAGASLRIAIVWLGDTYEAQNDDVLFGSLSLTWHP